MKKFLLMVVFLLSLTTSAVAQTIERTYTHALKTEKDGTKSGWIEVNVTFMFYEDLRVNIDVHDGGPFIELSVIGVTEEKTTTGGFKYDEIELLERSSGEKLIMQVFYESKYGIRLYLLTTDEMIQYTE